MCGLRREYKRVQIHVDERTGSRPVGAPKIKARRIRYTLVNVRSRSLLLARSRHGSALTIFRDTERRHTLVSENISFNVPYVRQVPSIDRGRRLAPVYKPSLSSIKRVLGCNLAITRTCRALATPHPTCVYACVYVWTRLRARLCMCASHGGCVFAGVSTRFLVAFVSVAACPVSNRFHQDRTSRHIKRTPAPRDMRR